MKDYDILGLPCVMKIAINGFGRIGRMVYRAAALCANARFKVVAINDLMSIENLAYLLKYDSVHRHIDSNIRILTDDHSIEVNGEITKVFNHSQTAELPWGELDIDCVVESSGNLNSWDAVNEHLEAGAKRVLLTKPASEPFPTFVMGVNHLQYAPEKDKVVSAASCTTHCLAILAKVLMENFGIAEGLMTTIHSITASQSTVDRPAQKNWRMGRASSLNIIPTSTGASKSLERCLPELQGKISGMAFRVPTTNVSVADLTVRLERDTSYEEVCHVMRKSAQGTYGKLLQYCEDPVVSSDFIGSTYSCIFDSEAGFGLNRRFYKLIAWYDNEMAYAYRVVDLIEYMLNKSPSAPVRLDTKN